MDKFLCKTNSHEEGFVCSFGPESSKTWKRPSLKTFYDIHCSTVHSFPLYPLFRCTYCSSVPLHPLFLCTHCTSVPLIPLFLCTRCFSVPTVPLYPLFLSTHSSSVPTVPLFLYTQSSSIPVYTYPLFTCTSVAADPLYLLLLRTHCSSAPVTVHISKLTLLLLFKLHTYANRPIWKGISFGEKRLRRGNKLWRKRNTKQTCQLLSSAMMKKYVILS